MLAMSLLTPVQSIVSLIILFLSTSLCLYVQGFILMGILYIMIYVGAIAILFLFILSLLNIEYKKAESVCPLTITILIICLIPLDLTYEPLLVTEPLAHVTQELFIIGSLFYTDYALLLLFTGFILILSVIGAINLTK